MTIMHSIYDICIHHFIEEFQPRITKRDLEFILSLLQI